MSTETGPNGLSLILKNMKTVYRPGEVVEGLLSWNLANPAGKIGVRLAWETRGKGEKDLEPVAISETENPLASGTMPFSFQLPLEPYSYSGPFISIVWSLECWIEGTGSVERQEIVVSPTGKEISFPPVE